MIIRRLDARAIRAAHDLVQDPVLADAHVMGARFRGPAC